MNPELFLQQPLVGILRGIDETMIPALIDVIDQSSLKNIEITMNTPQATLLIKKLQDYYNGAINIGAGTVLTLQQLHEAMQAGATFIVMPVMIKEIVNFCAKQNIPVFPGALTPTEVYMAWNEGATMVKVFPAKLFGPSYFKELKAPMHDIKLMAVGGISSATIKDYFSNGCDAVAFGANVFKLDFLRTQNIQPMIQEIKNMINLR